MTPPWIAPCLAAALVAGWLGYRSARTEHLVAQAAAVAARIEQVAPAAEASGAPMAVKRVEPESLVEKRRESAADSGPDWQAFGEAMVASRQGRMPDMREAMRMQKLLLEMDGEELRAALDEIAALEMEAATRETLRTSVLAILMQKDPQLALEEFFDPTLGRMEGASFMFPSALGQWAIKDPQAAEAWLDGQIAAGALESKSLDGSNSMRERFEGVMLGVLLNQGVEAASKRLATLPEAMRKSVFLSGNFMTQADDQLAAYAELVRQSLPEYEQGEVLAEKASMMTYQGGLERVSRFFEEIDARPAERGVIAEAVASRQLRRMEKLDRPALEETRAWLQQEVPERAEAITGLLLGSSHGERLKTSIELVEQLHREGGGDELLVGFLEQAHPVEHREDLRRLVEKIEAPEARGRMLERFETFGQPQGETQPPADRD